MTGQSIITRMEQHFKQIHLGIASYEFLRRYEAGIGYRFHCLHTDLDRQTAEAMEVQEIRILKGGKPTTVQLSPEAVREIVKKPSQGFVGWVRRGLTNPHFGSALLPFGVTGKIVPFSPWNTSLNRFLRRRFCLLVYQL